MNAPNSSTLTPDAARRLSLAQTSAPIPLESQWRRIARKLQEKDRKKSEFLARLSHELRNPLAPLSHGLHLLRSHPHQAALVEHTTAVMQRQLEHLVGLVDELLDIERMTQGKLHLRLQDIILQDVLQDALEISAPLMRERRHSLTITAPQTALWIKADPTRLTQVLSNLLINAAKYTPPGGSVHVSALAQEAQVRLHIQDSGAGIAAEELEHIFEPYAQVESQLPMAGGGLGLGLALAQQLVELHGGQISASSCGPGQGSTFTVTLPLCSAPLRTAMGTVMHTAKQTPMEPPPEVSACISPWRILVVDDNADGADTLAAALQCGGHEARAAHDGPSALEQARRWLPHAALLDLSMPGMDGFELARQLRLCMAPATLVAMTGWGTGTDRQRCEAAGFAAHLVKPASIEDIESVLARVLQARTDESADQRAERRNTC
ncbi:MAG: hybrid sensor histidine kinase/response regulator [Betaproteobacteria bacterium]